MKIGLDFHDVIDAEPKMFSILSNLFADNGHEVHIITGEKKSKKLLKELEEYNIKWTHFFSIVDHHKSIGTKITYDKNGDPWLDQHLWDVAKAQYCKLNGIDLLIDDSEIYGQYMDGTAYAQFRDKLPGFKATF